MIRAGDILSPSEAMEASQHRQTFESGIRRRLSKIPIDVVFDWTPIETDPVNAFLFFDRKGYPMSLPPRLACLAAAVEQAIADTVGRMILTLERSPTRAQRWLARAEEYRTIAETARSIAGRDAFLALAASCQQLAERLADYGALPSPGIVEVFNADGASGADLGADADEPREDAA